MAKNIISEAKRKFLSNETRAWADAGLITERQREDILGSYLVAKHLPAVVLSLGVAMIGIGILCFIAANWQVLPSWLKIVMIVGAYIGSVAAAYFLEVRGRPAASAALMLLSGFLLMGGLALIAQIFHIAGSPEGLILTWLVVYAPTFLIVRSVSIYILYEISALFYLNIKYYAFLSEGRRGGFEHILGRSGLAFHPLTLVYPFLPTLFVILLAGVAWWMWYERRKSDLISYESMLKRIFVGGSSRRIFLSNFMILNWFGWICAMNSTGRTVLPFVLGVMVIGAVISFEARRLDAADLSMQGLLCVGIAGFALSFPAIWDMYHNYSRSFLIEAISSSVVVCAYLVFRIVCRDRNGGLAVFLFCVFLSRWYFDMFYSFMSKSAFFISGGIIMLAIAYAYKKWNGIGRGKQTPPVAPGFGEIQRTDGDD
ncbi:MAG: DUF2157 domain-containing protein [Synergistaceae bacterium]|jgi:uncharacterized membrane protein|nr:DUF2157 domain-containing protein [Synergistaceae bacterium]